MSDMEAPRLGSERDRNPLVRFRQALLRDTVTVDDLDEATARMAAYEADDLSASLVASHDIDTADSAELYADDNIRGDDY